MSEPTTIPTLPQIQSLSEKVKVNLPLIQRGNDIGMKQLDAIKQLVITNDVERAEAVAALANVKAIYAKVNAYRVEVSTPLDEIKDFLMSFERGMDDKGKDNAYAEAKAVIIAYDQKKIDEKKVADAKAEVIRQTANYKAEIKAAVGRQMVDMMAGQKNTLISGMARWEKALTLENFDAKEKEINLPGAPSLKMDVYNACFHINFNRQHLMSEEATKEYIESLKLDFPYKKYNDEYQIIVTELKNEYRAKMGQIKIALTEAKANVEAEQKRLKAIEDQEAADRLKVQEQQVQQTQAVEEQKDMTMMESDFVKQGTLQGITAGPSKKEASFESDALWFKPLLEVISHVATSGAVETIRKKNGEYIDAVGWWLKKFENLGKAVVGVTLKDVSKTIIRKEE